MELKQIEYFVEIAKENNITRAAEKLFVTQSALNQQLLKLEKELGTPLFHRKSKVWCLTEAGEVYLENAKKMLAIKRNTYDIIRDIANIKLGSISIGLTPDRGLKMLANVLPKFQKEFTGIVVIPVEASVKKQIELINNNELDIGFMTLLNTNKKGLNFIEICEEELVLIIPKSHKMAEHETDPPSPIHMYHFINDTFCLIHQTSTLRPAVDKVFHDNRIKPNILFETANISAIVVMVRSGITCGITPWFHAKQHQDELAIFKLPKTDKFKIVACMKKDSYLSHAKKRLIEIASEYWNEDPNK